MALGAAYNKVLERWESEFSSGRWCLINPPDPTLAQRFDPDEVVSLRCSAGGPQLGADYQADLTLCDVALVCVPREKQLYDLLLALATSRIKPGGEIWVVGENRSGGKSADRTLREYCTKVVKRDSRSHCTLFSGVATSVTQPFRLDEWESRFDADVAGVSLTLASLPGVFASARLDPGTALLLDNMPVLSGHVADFGSGCGIISAWLASQPAVTRVTAVDDFSLAVVATRRTAEFNQLDNQIDSLSGDRLPDLNSLDAIVSNPPFHQGRETDTDVTRQLIVSASTNLQRSGMLVLVANAFLPYEAWLNERFERVEAIAGNRQFKVLKATGPRRLR